MFRRFYILVLLLSVSLLVRGQEELVSVQPTQVTKIANSNHNPTKALLLSLVPGVGQIYNHQAWKTPLFYVALGGVGYMAYNYYSEMMMFKKEYLSIGYNGSSTLPEYTGYPGSSIYNMYETANKNFQLFCIISVAVYGFNLLDAYVFGHLYDFNISDDLSLRMSPIIAPYMSASLGFAPSINLSLTF